VPKLPAYEAGFVPTIPPADFATFCAAVEAAYFSTIFAAI
jgi:hypothetical protein